MKDHFPNRLVFHICMFTLGYIPIKPHKTPTIPYSRAKRITINPHQIRIEHHWTPSNSKKHTKSYILYISPVNPSLKHPKSIVWNAAGPVAHPWAASDPCELLWCSGRFHAGGGLGGSARRCGDTAVSGAADVGMGLEATNWWGFKHHKWWKVKLSHFFNPWNMCNMGYVQLWYMNIFH